jgi:nicotinamide-nucleotide amidase
MRCGIINIGDEILAGKILNTNAFDLATRLTAFGHDVAFAITWPDDVQTLAAGFATLVDRDAGTLGHEQSGGVATFPKLDLLLITGGLGPTLDDITRDAIAQWLGVPLRQDAEATAWLAERLQQAPDALGAGQLRQVILPVGVKPLRNTQGTACGLGFSRHGVQVMAFPGVPSELEVMARQHLEPLLQGGTVLLRRLVWTYLSESKQSEYLRNWSPPAPFKFSSLPNERGVVLSLQACVPADEAEAQNVILEKSMSELIGHLPADTVIDAEGRDLPAAVVFALSEAGETLSVAESCTGGGLGFLITEAPGSSRIFKQGFLTYSNEAKRDVLGVPAALLAQHGAVSEATALAMARGCQLRADSTWAIAITGIAGPDGGSVEKPVGTVHIAVARRGGEAIAKPLQLKGTRNQIRWRSAFMALNLLRLAQKGHVMLNT